MDGFDQLAFDRSVADLRRVADEQSAILVAAFTTVAAATTQIGEAWVAWLKSPAGQRFMALTQSNGG